MPCHTVWTITVTYLHLRGAVSNIFQPTFLCPGASAGISSVRQRFPVPGCRLLSWMYFFWVVPLRFPVPKVNPDWCGRRMRTIYFAAEHPFKSVLQVYTFIRTCCERSPPKILELLRSQNHPIPRDEAGDKKNGTMSSKNRQFVGLVHFPWFSYIYMFFFSPDFHLTNTIKASYFSSKLRTVSSLGGIWSHNWPGIRTLPCWENSRNPKNPKMEKHGHFPHGFSSCFRQKMSKDQFFSFHVDHLTDHLTNSSSPKPVFYPPATHNISCGQSLFFCRGREFAASDRQVTCQHKRELP